MRQQDVIEFFNRCAPAWDDGLVTDDHIIARILDRAGIGAGCRVLDVACGTGVLFPYYLCRDVASVTGIDISPEMANIASGKYKGEPRIGVVCGDAENWEFPGRFDAVVVYNAFPHFLHPERLIAHLSSLLCPGGTLTVAHGASRESIDAHHRGSASHVSRGLMHIEELRSLFAEHLTVETLISDDKMYQVTGRKVTRQNGN